MNIKKLYTFVFVGKIYMLIVFFIVFSLQADAQELFRPKHSIKAEIGLPTSLINKPFKTVMQGLVQVAPFYQYATKFGLSFGAGADFRYFTINQFKMKASTHGGMTFVGGFVKIGFEKFISPKFAIDAGIRGGYDYVISKNNYEAKLIGKAHTFTTPYIEPQISFYLMADEASGFSLTLGYTFMGMKFSANSLMVDELAGFDASDFTKITQFFTVGFGYSYYFGVKKSE